MSAKMRRRRSHARRKRMLTRRREDGLFYAHGTIPASATFATICGCGARAFARDGDDVDLLIVFNATHAYCDEVAA